MTREPRKSTPGLLPADRAFHVVRDVSLSGPALELETRRNIWMAALHHCVSLLQTAIRFREWAMQTGATWNSADQAFPTPLDGLSAAEGMAQMAVVTFCTVFNSGWADEGKVAGNMDDVTKSFRELCVGRAFPDALDRAAFDGMLKRLMGARDSLLAHADGGAQQMQHSGTRSSFKPLHAGVPPDHWREILCRAKKLEESIKATPVSDAAI